MYQNLDQIAHMDSLSYIFIAIGVLIFEEIEKKIWIPINTEIDAFFPGPRFTRPKRSIKIGS